ncbi:MAG: hypothetical protein K2Y22_02285 [Candidatus Obscuribacterales bacterium]|nr:hypothetical protein [Candidatus Obscuribacterales bacterium]
MFRNIQLVLPSAILAVFVLLPEALAEDGTMPLARTNHLKIVSLPKEVNAGEDIILEAITNANAKCIITVASGDQELIGTDLVPKLADSAGNVKWQFKATDKAGKLDVYVHSVSGIADVGASTSINVQPATDAAAGKAGKLMLTKARSRQH